MFIVKNRPGFLVTSLSSGNSTFSPLGDVSDMRTLNSPSPSRKHTASPKLLSEKPPSVGEAFESRMSMTPSGNHPMRDSLSSFSVCCRRQQRRTSRLLDIASLGNSELDMHREDIAMRCPDARASVRRRLNSSVGIWNRAWLDLDYVPQRYSNAHDRKGSSQGAPLPILSDGVG